MKKLLLPIVTCLLLQGCAAAFVAGAATGGMMVYDRRDLATRMTDTSIRNRVVTKLSRDPEFKTSHIEVAVHNHAVLLVGQTPEESLRKRAEDTVNTLKNVERVYNEIQIRGPASLVSRSGDAWITAKVKTKMLGAKDLASGEMKVVTEDGTVYLLGKVTREQAELATNVTRRVAGVQRVVKVFEYTS